MWWGERDPGTRMTEHDRLLLQALTRYEADLCACGHPRDEAWSPDNDPANHEHVAHPADSVAIGVKNGTPRKARNKDP